MNSQLLGASDVAHILKVSKSCVYQLIRSGELPAVKFGKSVRVRPVDLESFISGNLINKLGGELEFLFTKEIA